MKRLSKQTKIVTMLVILTMIFLCAFNITYSYFTAAANLKGETNFKNLKLVFAYWSNESTRTAVPSGNSVQLITTASLIRESVSKLKTSADDTSYLYSLGLISDYSSCSAYVRFWVEAYIVEEIDGNVYFVDTKGNLLNANGEYVDSNGNVIEVETSNQGEMIDYGQYFEIGEISNESYNNQNYEDFTINGQYIEKSTNEGYVTYYLKNAVSAGDEVPLIDSIKMLYSAPSEILGTKICLYLSFEAVQNSNQAFKSEFDDLRGYCQSWV